MHWVNCCSYFYSLRYPESSYINQMAAPVSLYTGHPK